MDSKFDLRKKIKTFLGKAKKELKELLTEDIEKGDILSEKNSYQKIDDESLELIKSFFSEYVGLCAVRVYNPEKNVDIINYPVVLEEIIVEDGVVVLFFENSFSLKNKNGIEVAFRIEPGDHFLETKVDLKPSPNVINRIVFMGGDCIDLKKVSK